MSLLQASNPTQNPLSAGTLNLQKPGTPFVISGLQQTSNGVKTKVPGGINTNVPNKTTQPAPTSQQKAVGTPQTPTYSMGNGQGSIIPAGSTPQPQPTASPITGKTTTPSGAVVDASTGQTISAPQTQNLGGTVGQLISTAQQNAPIGQRAADIAAEYGKKIADVGTQGALAQEALQTTGGPSAPLLGNALAQAQLATARQQALGTAESAALQGTSQQLTAQQQEQSGLQQAGTLQTPGNQFITLPFNQQLVGADGQPIGGATGNGALQSAVVNAINLIKNGSGYSNAVSAANLAQFGPQGTTALLNALGPKFNVNMADADAAAVASNINTTGTAQTQAANTAYNSAVQKVAANTATYSALTGVSNNLNETLANWAQSGQLTALNQAINSVAGLTSNPEYQQFVTALGNAQASYQAALGASGVTPTKADQDAVAALSPNSSATAINAALNQLSADAHALLIVPAYQQQQTYAQQLGISQ